MKSIIILAIAVLCVTAGADTKLILDNKVFVLVEKEKQKCFDVASPEYLAQLFTLDFAQKNGENTAKALCKVKPQYCDSKEQINFGIQQIFTFVRELPSRFNSSGCAALRDSCQKKCEAVGIFAHQECFVECNQYEAYNKD